MDMLGESWGMKMICECSLESIVQRDSREAVEAILLRAKGSHGDDAVSPLASVVDWTDTARYTKPLSMVPSTPLHSCAQ